MKANIYQIFYDEKTRAQIDPAFTGIDNRSNPRPDWREYWVIRQFFLNNSVNENELYGFLSPSFHFKTRLSGAQVRDFIAANPGHDAYTFSPFIQDAACFLNIFEQGNLYHPGHVEVAQEYVDLLGIGVDLKTLTMNFRSTVYCNYIVATPAFWNSLFAISEHLFDLAERNDSDLAARLNSLTLYRLPVGMKVFLQERLASLVLALTPELRVCSYDLRRMPWSEPGFAPFQERMLALDQIKSNYIQTNDAELLKTYYTLRGAILAEVRGEALVRSKDGFIETPRGIAPQLLYICAADKPAHFMFPKLVSKIHLGAEQGQGRVNLRDMAPEWEPAHAALGTFGAAFALKGYLAKSGTQVKRVGLCTTDRFVTHTRLAAARDGAPGFYDVEASSLAPDALAEVMTPGPRDFLFAKIVEDSLSSAACDKGYLLDLREFADEAARQGVIERGEVALLFDQSEFVRGGLCMGVYETSFWLKAMTSIESIVKACLARATGPRRARQWPQCAERLGSYLLLRHLANVYRHIDWRVHFTGELCSVSEAAASVPVISI